MPTAATGDRVAVRTASPRSLPVARLTVLPAVLCAALLACHLVVRQRGAGWASPLLIGDWLFNLALALGILVLAAALGRRVAAPLLGQGIRGARRPLEPDPEGSWHGPNAAMPAAAHGASNVRGPYGAGGVEEFPAAEWLAALGVGYLLLSLMILGAGFLRLYYGPLFLVGAVALAVWLRADLADLFRRLGAAAARGRRVPPGALGALYRIIALVLLLTLLAACVRDMLPVTGDVPDWDGAAYHLSAPKIYVAAHRLLPVPDISLANAPSAADIIAVPGLMAGTDTLLKVLNLLFGVLLGLATYSFGARHFSRAAGALGAVLLLDLTWVVELLPATVPDLASAFLLVLGISDALAWLGGEASTAMQGSGLHFARRPYGKGLAASGNDAAGRAVAWKDGGARLWPAWSTLIAPSDRLLLRAGLLLGGGISCKLTALPALPALGGALCLLCLARQGVPLTRRLWPAARAGLLLGAATLVPLAPWLLKNLYFFGNPLYPQAVTSAGTAASVVCTGAGCTQATAVPSDRLAWMLHSAVQVFTGYVSPLSVLLLAAPFVLRGRPARAAMVFVVLGTALWLAFVPLFMPPRYWLGLIAVAEVLIAASVLDLLGRLRLPPRLMQAPLLVYLLLQGLYTLLIALGLMQRSDVLSLASGSTSPAAYLTARVRPYAAIAYANAHLPVGARVAMVHVTLGYYLDRPYLNDWYGTRAARLEGDPATRRAELGSWCRAGVRYAIVNRGSNEYNPDAVAGIRPLGAFAWVHEPGLRPRVLYSARGVDVLAVQPCAVPGAQDVQ